MKCPNDGTKITSKHYDPEYEIYECPKCGNAYTADELEEAENGTSPRKRAELAASGRPRAKGKIKAEKIHADEEALAKYEAETLKTRKSEDKSVHHRDEISTSDILEIVADEIESFCRESGFEIDRLNAREFYAMNIIRPLRIAHGVSFREKEVPAVYCKEHSG